MNQGFEQDLFCFPTPLNHEAKSSLQQRHFQNMVILVHHCEITVVIEEVKARKLSKHRPLRASASSFDKISERMMGCSKQQYCGNHDQRSRLQAKVTRLNASLELEIQTKTEVKGNLEMAYNTLSS